MRTPLYNSKVEYIQYGIREIVEVAQKLAALDPHFQFIGENIGDPVAKGWQMPAFAREILCKLIIEEPAVVFGYAHSRGNADARQWVAAEARKLAPACRLDAEHVLFANGLGAAISVFYRMLNDKARILQPNPGYPAHFSSERFSAGAPSLGYRLDPANGWQPDLNHMEEQIRRHPEIAGILLINPNNPTGAVYSAETLEAVIRLAERYQLMLISDEVYFRIVYHGVKYTHISEMAAGRVPLVVMRGVSKDVPWPGARCGWLEFHNLDLDQDFETFFEDLKRPLMLEVCATALPQAALARIYSHPEYARWNQQYCNELAEISDEIHRYLQAQPALQVNRINGAFYMMALFRPGVLRAGQTLPIACPAARAYIEKLTDNPALPLDKRFAYYLMAATGIAVVPASDFDSPWLGFRVTTLDRDGARRRATYQQIVQAISRYLDSV